MKCALVVLSSCDIIIIYDVMSGKIYDFTCTPKSDVNINPYLLKLQNILILVRVGLYSFWKKVTSHEVSKMAPKVSKFACFFCAKFPNFAQIRK